MSLGEVEQSKKWTVLEWPFPFSRFSPINQLTPIVVDLSLGQENRDFMQHAICLSKLWHHFFTISKQFGRFGRAPHFYAHFNAICCRLDLARGYEKIQEQVAWVPSDLCRFIRQAFFGADFGLSAQVQRNKRDWRRH